MPIQKVTQDGQHPDEYCVVVIADNNEEINFNWKKSKEYFFET